jgi:hypothetical protein
MPPRLNHPYHDRLRGQMCGECTWQAHLDAAVGQCVDYGIHPVES